MLISKEKGNFFKISLLPIEYLRANYGLVVDQLPRTPKALTHHTTLYTILLMCISLSRIDMKFFSSLFKLYFKVFPISFYDQTCLILSKFS